MSRHRFPVFTWICLRRREGRAVPLGEVRPEAAPGEGQAVLRIECLIAGIWAQHGPFLEIGVQHRRALAVFPVPRDVVPWERDRLLQVRLHRAIHGQADHVVEQVVADGADDVRWTNHVPLRAVSATVLEQKVFLRVVEVVL